MEPKGRVRGVSKVPFIFYSLSWVYESLLLLFNNLHVLSKKEKGIKLKICLSTFKIDHNDPMRQEAN